ncbi:MAG: hypothetical protein WAM60_03835, partial [Candidatus Promineifilaceae bacterium]
RFLEESSPAVYEADGLGLHLKWEGTDSLDTAFKHLDQFLGRFPKKPAWVTEAIDFHTDLSPVERAQEYIEWWHRLQQRPQIEGVVFLLGQAKTSSLEPFAWVGKGIAQIIGRRDEDVAGLVEDRRLPLGGTAGVGEQILKTWRIQNIGRTTWNNN